MNCTSKWAWQGSVILAHVCKHCLYGRYDAARMLRFNDPLVVKFNGWSGCWAKARSSLGLFFTAVFTPRSIGINPFAVTRLHGMASVQCSIICQSKTLLLTGLPLAFGLHFVKDTLPCGPIPWGSQIKNVSNKWRRRRTLHKTIFKTTYLYRSLCIYIYIYTYIYTHLYPLRQPETRNS